MKKFDRAEISHVPREQITRADILSKLASTKKKGRNKPVIQESLSRRSIKKSTTLREVNAIGDSSCWMTPIFNFLTKGVLPPDRREAAETKQRACSYVVLEHKLYQRGFSIPLLKCIKESAVPEILRKIHEGINTNTWAENPYQGRHCERGITGRQCSKTPKTTSRDVTNTKGMPTCTWLHYMS